MHFACADQNLEMSSFAPFALRNILMICSHYISALVIMGYATRVGLLLLDSQELG